MSLPKLFIPAVASILLFSTILLFNSSTPNQNDDVVPTNTVEPVGTVVVAPTNTSSFSRD